MRAITFAIILVLSMGAMAAGAAAGPWVFALADTVFVSGREIQLSDLSETQLPSSVADLFVFSSGPPGTTRKISRRNVLRRLVSAGEASGVSFRGANQCVIIRTGQTLDPNSLRPAIRRILQPLVPAAQPGAPATWFDLELPKQLVASEGEDLEVRLANPIRLEPGRNHVSIELVGAIENMNFPVTVTLHQFSETARAKTKIKRGDSLGEQMFNWEWTDLAVPNQKTDFYGRGGIFGVSSARTIRSGDYLRQCDLKSTPVVLTGDTVELLVQRGAVSVSVRATARQEGSIGQTIPVRNELTKRLVNARVVSAGVVKWRN